MARRLSPPPEALADIACVAVYWGLAAMLIHTLGQGGRHSHPTLSCVPLPGCSAQLVAQARFCINARCGMAHARLYCTDEDIKLSRSSRSIDEALCNVNGMARAIALSSLRECCILGNVGPEVEGIV